MFEEHGFDEFADDGLFFGVEVETTRLKLQGFATLVDAHGEAVVGGCQLTHCSLTLSSLRAWAIF